MASDDDRSKDVEELLNEMALRARRAAITAIKAPPAVDCEECGDVLHPRRLASVPHATRCAPCEDAYQRRQRRQGAM